MDDAARGHAIGGRQGGLGEVPVENPTFLSNHAGNNCARLLFSFSLGQRDCLRAGYGHLLLEEQDLKLRDTVVDMLRQMDRVHCNKVRGSKKYFIGKIST